MSLLIRVYGVPVPQGSTQAFAVRKAGKPTGQVVVTSDNRKVKPWRQAILDAVCDRQQAAGGYSDSIGPFDVSLQFFLPRPASHYGTGRNRAQLLPSAPARPFTRPDLDKLCRAVLDALTDALVWRDDSQAVSLTAAKFYAAQGERPGVEIEVSAYYDNNLAR